jgi:phage gp36-like protein
MAYATKADLMPRRLSNAELIQLTDDSSSGKINDAVVDAELTEASAKVDSYCRQRYQVPLQASDQIKGLTLDIASYLLFLRKRRVPEEIRQAFDDAIAFLKDVAAGKASLDQPVGAAAQEPATSAGVKATEVPERFSDDNLKGFA